MDLCFIYVLKITFYNAYIIRKVGKLTEHILIREMA